MRALPFMVAFFARLSIALACQSRVAVLCYKLAAVAKGVDIMARLLRKWLRSLPWVFCLCLLCASATALYTSLCEPNLYRAQYTLYALTQEADSPAASRMLANDLDALTRTEDFRAGVLEDVFSDGYTVVRVESRAESHLMDVVAQGPNRQSVWQLANAVGDALIEQASALGAQQAKTVSRASLPVFPAGPNRTMKIALAAVIVFVVGSVGGTVLCDDDRRFSARYGEPDALGAVRGLRKASRAYASRRRRSGMFLEGLPRLIREEVRACVLSLRALLGAQGRSVVIAGLDRRDQSAPVALSTAMELARQGFRVLLVEADGAQPALNALLDARVSADLLDVLWQRAEMSEAVAPTDMPGLWFLDQLHAEDALADAAATPGFTAFLQDAQAVYDCVIFHAPPLNCGADAAMLGAVAGAVALTVRDGRHNEKQVRLALERLRRLNGRACGVILT